MNLLLLDAAEISAEGRVELADRRAEHLRSVLRAEPGRTVRVGRIGGAIGVGRVVALAGDTVELDVSIAGEPAPRPRIDLIVALPRPQALKRVLQYAAAMGVGTIHLIRSWRVEKSFFQTPLLAPDAVRRQLLLGAEQGITTWLPEVMIRKRFAPFAEELAVREDRPLRLLAHPEAPQPLEAAWGAAPQAACGRVEIALGPEGGWIDREVASFRRAGFGPVSLGPWILRVETALAAVLAQVELLRRLAQGEEEHGTVESVTC